MLYFMAEIDQRCASLCIALRLSLPHEARKCTLPALLQQPLTYPRQAYLYDMVTEEDMKKIDTAFTIRAVFVIDPAKKVRLTMLYPASVGRNSSEVLRVIDSLQTGDKKGITTPIDWTPGDDVIVPPSVSTEDAKKKFGEVREVKPYLRYTRI